MMVKPKTITINNNTEGTIYPVLSTSKNETNEWVQACFRDNTKAYPTKSVYKLYVNEGVGIPKNTSVTITLPLFTVLSKEEDRYVTWWNGGRVVLADNNVRLRTEADVKVADPAGVTCSAGCQLTTYASDIQFPENIYAQLSEYTFGSSIFPAGDPKRLLKPENVGYNISYVDHVYMPVAIGVRNNPYIGYSGSAQPFAGFRESLKLFLAANERGEGWPVYNLSQLKLPGGYNVFAQRSDTLPLDSDMPVSDPGGRHPALILSKCLPTQAGGQGTCSDEDKGKRYGAAVQRMQNLWASCVDWGAEDVSQYKFPAAGFSCPAGLQATMEQVKQFYAANHANYLKTYASCKSSQPATPFNYLTAVTHIYGWVPYNENCGASFNALALTPGWDHAAIQASYIQDLQYNYDRTPAPGNDLIFNPYVGLIHQTLKMAAYGFSVDDTVGFMSELGDGLVFNVGGTAGLENDAPFTYASGFLISVGGVPRPINQPMIKRYGACALLNGQKVCAADVVMPTNSQIRALRIGTPSGYPVQVHFTDVKDNTYTFTVKQPFEACPSGSPIAQCPPNKADIIDVPSCTVVDKSGAVHPKSTIWCGAFNPNQSRDNGQLRNNLNTTDLVDELR